MKKFGILYICTGKYDIFRKEFYNSCEKYLLKEPEYEKHYFIWTDSKEIKGNNKIHVFRQENLGRPNNTLKRFHIFLSQEKELEKMDYLFFFNANLEIKEFIGDEILPKAKDVVVVAMHPGYFNKKNTKFTYDRNPKSTAFIKKGEGIYYVQGALNGGTSYSYIKMCKQLASNIDVDEKNGIIALRHDESHLNRYIYELEMDAHREKFVVLPPSYLYPEGLEFSFSCKILIRDKARYIDVNKIKGAKKSFKYYVSKIYRKILEFTK